MRFKLLFSSIFSFFLFNTFYCSILDYIFSVLFLAFEIQFRTQTLFVFCFQALILYCSSFTQFGCSILLWLGFFLSWSSFLGCCFDFFSIANYYSWVVKDWDFFDKKDINGNERLGFFSKKNIGERLLQRKTCFVESMG